MNKRLLTRLVLLFGIAVMLASCDWLFGPSDPEAEEPETDTAAPLASKAWTIMVYIDADCDLENYGMTDINELEAGLAAAVASDSTIMTKLNIVVQVDRVGTIEDDEDSNDTESYDDGDDWTSARRYYIQPDSTDTFASEVRERLGEVNMGDADTRNSFIEYSKRQFPATNYALILWNHGGGVRSLAPAPAATTVSRAVAWDLTDGDDALYTGEITSALDDTHDVQLLGMDACLMGMAEVAYQFRQTTSEFGADYFVASPHTEQGDGWPYGEILKRLAGVTVTGDAGYDASTVTTEQLAGVMVKEYGDFCTTAGENNDVLVAVDLSKMAAVKTAFDTFVTSLGDKTAAETARDAAQHYFAFSPVAEEGEEPANEWLDNPHFDLFDWADRMNATDLKAAVAEAVTAYWGGTAYAATAHTTGADGLGLGFFFPHNATDWAEHAYYTSATYTEPAEGEPYGGLLFLAGTSGWDEKLTTWYGAH